MRLTPNELHDMNGLLPGENSFGRVESSSSGEQSRIERDVADQTLRFLAYGVPSKVPMGRITGLSVRLRPGLDQAPMLPDWPSGHVLDRSSVISA